MYKYKAFISYSHADIAFARWLNPDFAVWCDMQIEEILKPKNSSKPAQTSYFLENLDSQID